MSVIRVGSTTSYAEGWDLVFGSAKTARRVKKTKTRASAGKAARKPPAKASKKRAKPKKARR